ncbi:MAG: alpha/beta hydrolase [Aquabacterium sp.]|nr:alpha/beta hydrolase [Aquabacterium sp.]
MFTTTPSSPDAARPRLPQAVPGEVIALQLPGFGRVAGVVAGAGPPLLLLHSVNAAASAAEVRTLHQRFSASRTVLSIDLPGYGLSDRPDVAYTPRLMTDALLTCTAWLRQRCGGAPVDALALSLSCEYLARAAAERPADYRSLALVSPTGFMGRKVWRAAPGTTREVPGLLAALRGPGWGGALFRGLTRPGVIRYFLQRTWGGKAIDETLWQYDLLTSRQPGAEHAPLHFLSAGLFSADIQTLYAQLAMPVWMSHGVRGDFTDYRGSHIVRQRPNWQFSVYPTGALPQFEVPARFHADMQAFLDGGRVAAV